MPHQEETIDYSFLLLTHIVCADRQIHSEESKALYELADLAKVGQKTQEEMDKILSQDEYHLFLEDIACRVTPGKQNETMRQLLAIAYADGFIASSERETIDRIANCWNWSPQQINQILKEAEEFTQNKLNETVNYLNRGYAKRIIDCSLEQYEILSVAFIGQYSAGKSTIISALTGKRDIKIDADIATDKTTSYEWNKIKLIDTPGLFTDRINSFVTQSL